MIVVAERVPWQAETFQEVELNRKGEEQGSRESRVRAVEDWSLAAEEVRPRCCHREKRVHRSSCV